MDTALNGLHPVFGTGVMINNDCFKDLIVRYFGPRVIEAVNLFQRDAFTKQIFVLFRRRHGLVRERETNRIPVFAALRGPINHMQAFPERILVHLCAFVHAGRLVVSVGKNRVEIIKRVHYSFPPSALSCSSSSSRAFFSFFRALFLSCSFMRSEFAVSRSSFALSCAS